VDPLVRKNFAVLRFDLYGRGRSARPDVTYDPELFAGQLHELVATLQLPAQFHIVASSMGAIVAATFASRHPNAVDRIVLVSPAGLSETFPSIVTLLKVPRVGRWYFRHWFKDIMLDHLRENLLADYRTYPDVLAEVRHQIGLHGSADAMYSTLRRTLLRNHKDEFRGLGGLHRPTRVLWGTEDRLVPFRDSRAALESSIPHHELCAVPHAAHLPQLEQPRRFNALVNRFLAARPDDRSTPCEKGPLK
jgi:pimeloyl-ACP methyl ester carboxylesterase